MPDNPPRSRWVTVEPGIRRWYDAAGAPGSYQVRVRVGDARVRPKLFTRLKDARAWRDEQRTRARQVDGLGADFTRTVSDACDLYLRSGRYAELGDRNRKQQAKRVEWWREQLGSTQLHQLRRGHVAGARDDLITGGLAPSTANRYLSTLSVVLQVAAERDWVTANPVAQVRRGSETGRGRTRVLRDHEYEAIRAAFAQSPDRRLLPLFLCYLSSGARREELVSLRWEALDVERGRARLEASDTKARRSRTIYLHGEALDAIRQLPRSIGGYVWAHPATGSPTFPRVAWERGLELAARETGDDALLEITPHILRHSCGTALATLGASALEIAEYLGHGTSAMAERYVHLAETLRLGYAGGLVRRLLAA